MEENKNQIETALKSALLNLKELIDVSTVIGKPQTDSQGMSIIPISKVTMCYVVGGGEYSETTPKKEDKFPMSAGSGGYISLSPVGFLVGSGDKMRSIKMEEGKGSYDKLLDTTLDFISNKMK